MLISTPARSRCEAVECLLSSRLDSRHACATHVLESSNSIREVQELLGHASISTTQIYTHLNAQHLLEAYMKSHPRAHRVKDRHE